MMPVNTCSAAQKPVPNLKNFKQELAIEIYELAREWSVKHWPDDIRNMSSLGRHTLASMTASEFLSKYCWVVYASGFKASILKSLFPKLSKAFHDFEPDAVASMHSTDAVLQVFRSERKAQFFIKGARAIREIGFETFKEHMLRDGIDTLQALPGIGPITKKHLARNIGLADVAKDDIWLTRFAKAVDAPSVDALVNCLKLHFGYGAGIVDIVLWRFCAEKAWNEIDNPALNSLKDALAGKTPRCTI